MQLRSQTPIPNETCGGIWYYVDSLGNEYALVAASQGLGIYNVTNPDSPFLVKKIPGPDCIWHEVRTYKKYAYVTTECDTLGVQIIDLSKLPTNTIPDKFWRPTVNNAPLNTSHTLQIDNNNLYVYGTNCAKGYVVADITDPWNPVVLGNYSDKYIHDGYVRNDTVYGGHIYDGYFSVINATNQSNPIVLQTQTTPRFFTHNTWLSDNSKIIFATDERSNSTLTSYDISDLNNINELDRMQCTPRSGSIIHNTYVKNDWVVNSWYKDGVNIVDGHKPDNLVQVGWYDTHPNLSGDGFEGIWGACPFLPSGNILASALNEGDGFFVFTPTYVRACYLEGNIMDSICNIPINDVKIEILSTNSFDYSDISGVYKMGYHIPGTYTVKFSKKGYYSKTISNVSLSATLVTNINIKMYSDSIIDFKGKCEEGINGIPGVEVLMQNSTTDNTYNYVSNSQGDFNSNYCSFLIGDFDIYAGRWGYITNCFSKSLAKMDTSLSIPLNKGYYDDFTFDFGWTVVNSVGTYNEGWDRQVENTDFQLPDVGNDCSNQYFAAILNNYGNSQDSTTSELISPKMNLTTYTDPYFNFYVSYFEYNAANDDSADDSLFVILKDGLTEKKIDVVYQNNTIWDLKSYRIMDYIQPSSATQVVFKLYNGLMPLTATLGFIDKFEITEGPIGLNQKSVSSIDFKLFPNPFTQATLLEFNNDFVTKHVNSQVVVTDVSGRVYERISVTSNKISIGNELPSGIYLTYLYENGSIKAVKKLIKY